MKDKYFVHKIKFFVIARVGRPIECVGLIFSSSCCATPVGIFSFLKFLLNSINLPTDVGSIRKSNLKYPFESKQKKLS